MSLHAILSSSTTLRISCHCVMEFHCYPQFARHVGFCCRWGNGCDGYDIVASRAKTSVMYGFGDSCVDQLRFCFELLLCRTCWFLILDVLKEGMCALYWPVCDNERSKFIK